MFTIRLGGSNNMEKSWKLLKKVFIFFHDDLFKVAALLGGKEVNYRGRYDHCPSESNHENPETV